MKHAYKKTYANLLCLKWVTYIVLQKYGETRVFNNKIMQIFFKKKE